MYECVRVYGCVFMYVCVFAIFSPLIQTNTKKLEKNTLFLLVSLTLYTYKVHLLFFFFFLAFYVFMQINFILWLPQSILAFVSLHSDLNLSFLFCFVTLFLFSCLFLFLNYSVFLFWPYIELFSFCFSFVFALSLFSLHFSLCLSIFSLSPSFITFRFSHSELATMAQGGPQSFSKSFFSKKKKKVLK